MSSVFTGPQLASRFCLLSFFRKESAVVDQSILLCRACYWLQTLRAIFWHLCVPFGTTILVTSCCIQSNRLEPLCGIPNVLKTTCFLFEKLIIIVTFEMVSNSTTEVCCFFSAVAKILNLLRSMTPYLSFQDLRNPSSTNMGAMKIDKQNLDLIFLFLFFFGF